MSTNLKEMVREKYSTIAEQSKAENATSCCGATGCGTGVYNIMADDYSTLEGYNANADLGLGCGLPTAFAKLQPGHTVVDLGSGAGNDCFVAQAAVGATGRVIGIDFSDTMLQKARANAQKLQATNVEFRQGDLEDLPLTSNIADVVISNCVLNLVPNKHKVFSEVFRVLKPGGHFSISDVVLQGHLPAKWQLVAELYAGCISGAIQKQDYLNIIAEAGFDGVLVQKEKEIVVPADILAAYLTPDEVIEYQEGTVKIQSITVFGQKPETVTSSKCAPGGGCC
ncbi:MAG: methyltransferase domain-containing protein [Bacteroidetes bacterium]|nr:MAG: methyltransferase domain-containing protein [Bacteroidota bacterium]